MAYPDEYPDFTGQVGFGTQRHDDPAHDQHHQNVVDLLVAFAIELGLNPSGAYESVAARLEVLQDALGEGFGVMSNTVVRIEAADTPDPAWPDGTVWLDTSEGP